MKIKLIEDTNLTAYSSLGSNLIKLKVKALNVKIDLLNLV